MKVAIDSVELTDDILKSIRRAQGRHGKATRVEAKQYINGVLENLWTDLVTNYPPNKRPSTTAAA